MTSCSVTFECPLLNQARNLVERVFVHTVCVRLYVYSSGSEIYALRWRDRGLLSCILYLYWLFFHSTFIFSFLCCMNIVLPVIHWLVIPVAVGKWFKQNLENATCITLFRAARYEKNVINIKYNNIIAYFTKPFLHVPLNLIKNHKQCFFFHQIVSEQDVETLNQFQKRC